MYRFIIAVLLFLILSFDCLAGTKPNFILLIADDMGWLDTGYNGNSRVKTPVLDEIAARGIRFDYFYAAGPVCCPGRYAILTGKSPLRGGLNENRGIREDEEIIPRVLGPAGYNTAYFGKWHLGIKNASPVGMGFELARWTEKRYELDPRFHLDDTDDWVATTGDGSIAVMDLALEFIRKQSQSPKPFLVVIGFSSPHKPYNSAPEYSALYKDLPESDASYFGEISGLDAAIGNLRKEIRALGIAENTLLWFMSDNGGKRKEFCDPAGRGKGHIGARTVSVMEWPGRIKAGRTTIPVSHLDVFPTLLDLAGSTSKNPKDLDGTSIQPLMQGNMSRRPIPLPFMMWEQIKHVNTGKFPYIDFIKDTQGIWIDGNYELTVEPQAYPQNDPVRLFHIYDDPTLKNNLVESQPDIVSGMRAALEKWKASVWESYKNNMSRRERKRSEKKVSKEHDHQEDSESELDD